MGKLRVGIVGCGAIGTRRHIPEYAQNAHVQLAAFCDIRIERAEEQAAKYGGAAYQDYQTMLAEADLDAVSVCTPNALHAPVSIAAAKAGCHVLCEKPMAVTGEEAEAMIQAAKDNGVLLMIAHNQRYMPPHVKAKQILREGSLGRVLTFRTAFGHGGPESWSVDGKESWFFRKEEAYVGAMGDLGVHKADLIRWLLDDEVAEVSAFVENLDKGHATVDDNAICLLRMKSGALGTLTASWTYYKGEDNSTILYCEKGVLKIGAEPDKQVIVEHKDRETEFFNPGVIATNERQVSSGVIDAFVEAAVSGKPSPIPGEEGLKSLKVIIACMEAAREKKTVSLL